MSYARGTRLAGVSAAVFALLCLSSPACAPGFGEEGDRCSQNGFCEDGLVCLDDRCVAESAGCSNRCDQARNGVCEDGRAGAEAEVCSPGTDCSDCGLCLPDCEGRECGSDGCGGSCGTCGDDQVCESNVCGPPSPTLIWGEGAWGSGRWN